MDVVYPHQYEHEIGKDQKIYIEMHVMFVNKNIVHTLLQFRMVSTCDTLGSMA